MARVRLTASHHINNKVLKPGTAIADSQGAALAGDVVWTGLTAATYSNAMVSLDAGGDTLRLSSRFPVQSAPGFISGANSIEA